MCDSSFNQSAFVALVFVTGTCNLYIRPTFIFCIPVRGTLLHYNRVIRGNWFHYRVIQGN
jgi:hypothetical protein